MRSLLRVIAVIFVCLFAAHAGAQVQVAPFLTPNQQFFDNNGNPLAGGKVCTFSAGTTTPLASYSDLGVTLNSNPIILDSAGRGNIFLTTAAYKIVTAASTATSQCSPSISSADNVSWNNLAQSLSSLTVTGPNKIVSGTAATSGANQTSPTDSICGNYWTGVVSAQDCWAWSDVLGTGANPTSTLTLTHSGSSGTTALNFAPPLTFNTINVAGNASVGNNLSVTGNETVGGTFGAGSYTNNLSAFAATTSVQLASVISDETGSGPLPFANGAVFNSKNENGAVIIHVDQYTSWALALADCPTEGCVLDGRSPNTPTAIGTFDSGTTAAVTILLGPMTYTVDHFILRSGLAVIGMGIENIQGTKIQAVGAANQAPFIMPTSGSLQSVQGVILRDFELEATAGNTAQDGIFIDVSVGNLPAGSNFESSTIERITFNSFKGSARHLKGRIDTPSSAIQFNNFVQNDVIVPSGNTTAGAALRIEGTVGQNFFWNDTSGESIVSGTTNIYIGVTNTADTSGPYSNWFYSTTIQGGDIGVLVNGCQACTFRDTHAEADKILFQVKTPTTWHNNKLLLDGGVANGNVGTNSGAGRVVDASDSSNTFGTTVELSHWAIEGSPDKMATCNNGTNVIMHDNSFDQATPSMITTGCTPGYSTSTTTLNTANSHVAFVNGCSGGTVTTLTSGLGVNEYLTLYFNAACILGGGGNIQLINGYPSPLAFNLGEVATFVNNDISGSNVWLLSSTTAARANGFLSSPGRVAALTSTAIYTTGATDGFYLFTMVATCKTPSAGSTVTPSLSYTDPSGTVQTVALSAATCTTLGASSQTSATSGLNIKASTNVNISATIVSTPTYDIRAAVVKLGGN